jgi:SAM-dependent methyltransferase
VELTKLAKRAALGATVRIGGFQRRMGRRFPGYGSFCNRAAGYAAYALAGAPFVRDEHAPAAVSSGGGGPAGAAAVPVVETGSDYAICLEEPLGRIDVGSFQVRGWTAWDGEVPELRAEVNGRELRIHRYERPDVRREFPHRRTAGFSAFVRLGDVPDPEGIEIGIAAGARRLLACRVDVSRDAVEAGRNDREARRHKREWILPRMICVRCGGSVDDAACCRSCGCRYESDGVLDCMIPDECGRSYVDFNGAVCSHGYDGDVERIVARAEAVGGKVLDCGSGLRAVNRANIVTTDIFAYPTIDVLAVNQHLPFADEVFDAVLSLHVLEHVADPFACARELCRVLKPGGTLFAVTPMIVPEHGYPHHFFNPTREGIARLFDRTSETARVFVPETGHPINAVWTVLAFYRDSLPESQRAAFSSLTVREFLSRPMEHWMTQDIARALGDDGRTGLAGNFCIEFTK